ncbi:Hypothetical predicted protein [Octopus vulgaris]|uniref:Uncharacterized protein n=1 Tax=Octopus vulgaris TaxID=6645 RepID=A0AA36ALW2_OCTVU|nr:Hypothetical predicted protein [Octopus vulgaris]
MRETTIWEYEERGKILNAHVMWSNILRAKKRTVNNFQATNNDIQTLYELHKDHKTTIDPVTGPPTRPACGANVANNYRISYCLSMIICPLVKMSSDVCDTTEDVLSRINECNHAYDLTGCIIGSMDVVSPYPSTDVDSAVEKCVEVISEGDVQFRGVDTEELGFLLRPTCDNDYLDKPGLICFCPTRLERVKEFFKIREQFYEAEPVGNLNLALKNVIPNVVFAYNFGVKSHYDEVD